MINKKRLLSVTTAILLSSNLFGANNEKIYALVNGDKVTNTDIAMILRDPRVNFDLLPQNNKKQILNQIISKKLLEQKAIMSDVIQDPLYKDTLEKTIKSLKKDLALQMWMQKVSKKIVISEKELKDYYNKHKSKLTQPPKLKARHILLKTEKEAQEIINRLKKSKNIEKDFIKLAKEKSIGPSGKNGGELGWFTKEQMVPEFSKACLSMNKGTVSNKPVKTQFGYHIIYLEDKKQGSITPFENVKNQIKQFLLQKKFKEKLDSIVDDLKSKAKIIYK